MALSMFPLTTHSSPQHSVLNKNWLPSRAWKAAATITTRIAVDNKGSSRSKILCSAGGGDAAAAAAAAATVLPEPIDIKPTGEIKRSDFPPDFFFGASTSAYQIEGAWNEDGKGPSIWDTFTHEHPEKIGDGKNGDLATDSYHRYKEDVKIMKDMGMNSYRFSISWSRILPDGTKDKVNDEGIHYYNNLINELINNGITPFVTLFHWDVPQALEEKYGGFRSKKIVNDFEDFARVCFTNFGDKVKHWITLNEPWTFSINGYCTGNHAPGRCTPPECADGNSGVDPYTVSHHLILAHAHAVKLYKDHFQAKQKGEIGITLVSFFFVPYSDSDCDKEAAKGALDFMLGWYMDPIVNGDYPKVMREKLPDRLPKFSEEQKALIEGTYDFIGINYYTSMYAQHKQAADARSDSHYVTNNRVLLTGGKPVPTAADYASGYFDDFPASLTDNKDGVPIGKKMSDWIYLVPKGITNLLLHIKGHYKNPNIYITENGTCDLIVIERLDGNEELVIEDDMRIEYITDHLIEVNRAMNPKGDNVSVKGYFIWSIIDNFEWEKGYKDRFGLVRINYDCDLKRTPKKSADWCTSFLRS